MSRLIFALLSLLFIAVCVPSSTVKAQSRDGVIQPVASPLSYRYFSRGAQDNDDKTPTEDFDPQSSPNDRIKSDETNKSKSKLKEDQAELDALRDSSRLSQSKNQSKDRSPESATSDDLWSRKPIGQLRLDIREDHSVAPADRSDELDYGAGDWNQFYASPKLFAWAAPDIRYQPLFFEDVPLERYGQTTGIKTQPIRSAVHFFNSVVFLPNHLRHDHWKACDYPLGFCRPGSNVPGTKQLHYYGPK